MPRYEFMCEKCKKPFELIMTISEREKGEAKCLKCRGTKVHKTEAMYARYDIPDEEDLKDAVIKTQAYVETLPRAPASSATPIAPR